MDACAMWCWGQPTKQLMAVDVPALQVCHLRCSFLVSINVYLLRLKQRIKSPDYARRYLWFHSRSVDKLVVRCVLYRPIETTNAVKLTVLFQNKTAINYRPNRNWQRNDQSQSHRMNLIQFNRAIRTRLAGNKWKRMMGTRVLTSSFAPLLVRISQCNMLAHFPWTISFDTEFGK